MTDLTVPWVLLRVRDQLFGVPASNIREMAEMPPVTPVPNMPEFVLGLVSLRGQVTPTIDMRRRLGVAAVEDDIQRLTKGLEQAEADHLRLGEILESVVRDGRADRVDVSGCAFTQWRDGLKTRNPLVQLHLKKLDEPHARLHAAAARVLQAAQTNPSEANEILRNLREKELPAFTRLLSQIRERMVYAHRQIVVVLTFGGRSLGAAVDEVESIERLKDGSIEALPAHLQGLESGLTKMVGRRTRDDEVVLILEVEELFHGRGREPLHGDWISRAESTPASAPEPAPVTASPAAPGIKSGALIASPATPDSGAPDGMADRLPAAATYGAAGPDDSAWCGDRHGPWIQLADGPFVQPSVTWDLEEAESSGSPGSSWM